MASASDLLLPLRQGLVPVPAATEVGVCRVCHSACDATFEQCYPCREALRAIGAPEVLPIALSVDGGLLHRHLRGYKDDRSHQARARMGRRLAAMLAIFLQRHHPCVGEFDSVVLVPSPRRIAVESIVGRLPALRNSYLPALAVSGQGPSPNSVPTGSP